MNIKELLFVFIFLAVIILFFYFYIKALTAMMIKKARKQVSGGKLSDKKLTKFYQNYANDKLFFYFLLGGPFYYLHMKKTSPILRDIYYQEMQRRNLPT